MRARRHARWTPVADLLADQLAELATRAAGLPARPPRIGSVHGQMQAADRDATMERFRAGRARGARRHDRAGGGRRRPRGDGDGRPRCRPLRSGPAAPAARPRRPGQRAQSYCVLVVATPTTPWRRARLRPRSAETHATASSWPRRTSSCAARASCWALRRAGCRRCAWRACRIPEDRALSRAGPRDRRAPRRRPDGTLEPGHEALRASWRAAGWQVGAGEASPSELGGETGAGRSTARWLTAGGSSPAAPAACGC